MNHKIVDVKVNTTMPVTTFEPICSCGQGWLGANCGMAMAEAERHVAAENSRPKTYVNSAAYHRNGISGEGFYVGLVVRDDNRFLVTWFPEYDDDDMQVESRIQSRIAVVDVNLAAAGDIAFGSNSWRAEHFVDAARAIRDAANARI